VCTRIIKFQNAEEGVAIRIILKSESSGGKESEEMENEK